MLRVVYQLQILRQNWRLTCAILRVLHQLHELNQLIRWAQKKRLRYPLQTYENRLLDMEVLLNRYMLKKPGLMRLAGLLYWINRLVTPTPKFYKQGSAAKYGIQHWKIQTNKRRK